MVQIKAIVNNALILLRGCVICLAGQGTKRAVIHSPLSSELVTYKTVTPDSGLSLSHFCTKVLIGFIFLRRLMPESKHHSDGSLLALQRYGAQPKRRAWIQKGVRGFKKACVDSKRRVWIAREIPARFPPRCRARREQRKRFERRLSEKWLKSRPESGLDWLIVCHVRAVGNAPCVSGFQVWGWGCRD